MKFKKKKEIESWFVSAQVDFDHLTQTSILQWENQGFSCIYNRGFTIMIFVPLDQQKMDALEQSAVHFRTNDEIKGVAVLTDHLELTKQFAAGLQMYTRTNVS